MRDTTQDKDMWSKGLKRLWQSSFQQNTKSVGWKMFYDGTRGEKLNFSFSELIK